MQRLDLRVPPRDGTLRFLGGVLGVAALGGALAAGCGDDAETNPTTSTTTTTTTTGGGGEGGGTGGAGGSGAMGGGGGGLPGYKCDETAKGATRGSAIAVSPDDSTVVSVNRDAGTVTVARVDYSDGQPALTKVAELNLGAGSEPWQVAIDACGRRAYVVLRKDQRVVAIDKLDTVPEVGPAATVGSEPTSVAVSPNNTAVHVANWVDGTVSVIDPLDMSVKEVVDLNSALAGTGLLGTVAARPALAHPRAIAITNNGDADDTDETVLVTEWFAQRTGVETAATADTNKKGLVYRFAVGSNDISILDLPPILDTGFPDHNNVPTGCFPNQVGSITVDGGFAYVTSVCASPKGPIGVFQQAGACAVDTQCGAVGGVCNLATLTCNPNPTDVKTTTHPALTILDLTAGTSTTIALDQRFADPGVASARMPHMPTDLGFLNTFAYVSASGSDAVFRLQITDGNLVAVGSQVNDFINLRRGAADALIRNPIGIAVANGAAFAFVANDGSRDITALSLGTQSIAGNAAAMDFRILQASDLPAAGSPEDTRLRGKRFFNTGLGRWSLGGEAWGSCAACHVDGLSDNVTWYFARGPRQSTSLDGSFAPGNPTDQRIFNWTAVFDEVADFELNTRGVSGGVGAIVSAAAPVTNAQRINLAGETPPQQGLQGSTGDVANPVGISGHPHSVLSDWIEIEAYMQGIRSPRRPTGLSVVDVAAGAALFGNAGQANCVGCHSGAKWTISTLFYAPDDIPNAATASGAATSLSNISWNVANNNFPTALWPITTNPATDARMRFGAPPGAEQIQCILRPVGTFGVSPIDVGVVELRQDMTTVAQGNAPNGRGYNPPSLLGLQVGAPFFHAGNARTLEELLDDTLFNEHHRSAIAQVFTPDADTTRQLVAFMLSIDEDRAALPIPALGATGGDLCFYP